MGGRSTQFARTVTAGAHPLSILSVSTYPIDENGLAAAQLDESFSGGLNAGEKRDFETISVQSTFTEYMQFADFYE